MDSQWRQNKKWGPWRGPNHNQNHEYFSEEAEFRRAYHSDRASSRRDHMKKGKKKTRWDNSTHSRNEHLQVGFDEKLSLTSSSNLKEQCGPKDGNKTGSEGNRPLYSMVASGNRGNRLHHGRDLSHRGAELERPPPDSFQERPSTDSFQERPSTDGFQRTPSNDGFQRRTSTDGFQRRPPQNSFQGRPPQNSFQGRPPQNSFQGRPPQNSFQGRPPQNSFQGRPPQNSFQGRSPQNGFSGRSPENGFLGPPPLNGHFGRPPQNAPFGRLPQNAPFGRSPQNNHLGRPPMIGRKSPCSWEEDEGNEISHWLQANKDNLPRTDKVNNSNKDPLPGSEEERNNALKKATELLKQSLKKKMSVNLNELLTGDQVDKLNHSECHTVSKILGLPKNLAELELNENDLRLIGRAQPAKDSTVEDENSDSSDDIIELRRSPSPLRDVIDLDLSPEKSSASERNENSTSQSDQDSESSLRNHEAASVVAYKNCPSQSEQERESSLHNHEGASVVANKNSLTNTQQDCNSFSPLVLDATNEMAVTLPKGTSERMKDCHTAPISPKESSERGPAIINKVLCSKDKHPEDAKSSNQEVNKLPKHSFTSPSPKINRRRPSLTLSESPSHRSSRPSPITIANLSRHNKVISDLKKISQTKLRNLINNPRCGKLDFAMQQLQKEHRALISQKSRETAEKMIPAQNLTPKPDVIPDERSVLADLSIDWNSLPSELIDTLGDIFSIESDNTLLPQGAQDADADAEAVPLKNTELQSSVNGCGDRDPIKLENICEEATPSIPTSTTCKEATPTIIPPTCEEATPAILPPTTTCAEAASTVIAPTNVNEEVTSSIIPPTNICEGTTPTVIPPTSDKLIEHTPVRIRVAQFARQNFVEVCAEDLQNKQVGLNEVSDRNCQKDSLEDNIFSLSTINVNLEESTNHTSDGLSTCHTVDSTVVDKIVSHNEELPNQKKGGLNKRSKGKKLVRLEERSWFEEASQSNVPPVADSTAGSPDPLSRVRHNSSSSFISQESVNNINDLPSNENDIMSSNINEIPNNAIQISSDVNEVSNNAIQVLSNVNEMVTSNMNQISNDVNQISTSNQTAMIMPIMCMTVSANTNSSIVNQMTVTEIEKRLNEIDVLLQKLVQEKCLLHDTLNNLKSGIDETETNQQNTAETEEIEEVPANKRISGLEKTDNDQQNSLRSVDETEGIVEVPASKRKSGLEKTDNDQQNSLRNADETEEIVEVPASKRISGLEEMETDQQNSLQSADETEEIVEILTRKRKLSISPVQNLTKKKRKNVQSSGVDNISTNSSTITTNQKVNGRAQDHGKSKDNMSYLHKKSNVENVSSTTPQNKSKNVSQKDTTAKNVKDVAETMSANTESVKNTVSNSPKRKVEGLVFCIKTFKTTYLAASQNGVVYQLRMDNNEVIASYGEESGRGVLCIEVQESKESNVLFTGGSDGYLRVFSVVETGLVESNLNLKPMKSHNVSNSISCLAYNWGTAFIGTMAGCIVPYNVKEGKLKESLSLGGNGVLSMLTVKEGPRKVIVVGCRNQPISIRDAETGLLLRQIGMSSWSVYSLSFYNNMLFCGADKNNIAVFDFQSGKHKYKLSTGKGIVSLVQADSVLFCACYDGNIYIFDLKGQKGITTMKGPGKMILCIAVINRRLYCSSKKSPQLMVTELSDTIQSVMNNNK